MTIYLQHLSWAKSVCLKINYTSPNDHFHRGLMLNVPLELEFFPLHLEVSWNHGGTPKSSLQIPPVSSIAMVFGDPNHVKNSPLSCSLAFGGRSVTATSTRPSSGATSGWWFFAIWKIWVGQLGWWIYSQYMPIYRGFHSHGWVYPLNRWMVYSGL